MDGEALYMVLNGATTLLVGVMIGRLLAVWDFGRRLREKARNGTRLAMGGALYEIKCDGGNDGRG